tara:strand:- start:62 stop:328 length:267 start_codon:yes stop_codon:yes gene_type:complete
MICLNKKYLNLFDLHFSNTFSVISEDRSELPPLLALRLSGIPYYWALTSHKLAVVELGIGASLRNYRSMRVICLLLIKFNFWINRDDF